MKKFLLKLLIYLSVPIAIIATYFVNDPFKVLYHYDQYYKSGISENIVSLNKDYVSTQHFINNYQKYPYDSYIFGSSRSIHVHIDDWMKHINAKQCYHFDATAETLFGVERKVAFIHRMGMPIKNALFVLDYSILRKIDNGHKHLYIKHPAISGEGMVAFQLSFFKDFLEPAFLNQYIYYLFTRKANPKKDEIQYIIKQHSVVLYDSVSNELQYQWLEDIIRRNPDSFYNGKRFYARDHSLRYYNRIIGENRTKMLMNIKRILDEDHTNYRILINPLYDQMKLDTNDMKVIVRVFGKENVFDFSGVNDITDDRRNFYEISHYRPQVAARMLDTAYAH